MKRNNLLESVLRKILIEDARMIRIRPGSDKAVIDAWSHGVAQVGSKRTVFEVVARTSEKDENIIDSIYYAIAADSRYGDQSYWAKEKSDITPYGTKYMYIMGTDVSKLPRWQKYNVWICNLELIYIITNQIDELLGLNDKLVSTLESVGPTHRIGNIPLFTIDILDRMQTVVQRYINLPELKGKLKIPNIGSSYDSKTNTVTLTGERIFPDLRGLDKDFTPDTSYGGIGGETAKVSMTGTELTVSSDESDASGYLNFTGTGKQYYTSTGDRKFMPTNGTMTIYRQSDNIPGTFTGTFKNGYIDNGTVAFNDMKPYTGTIPLTAVSVLNIESGGMTQISFSIDFKGEKK